MKSMIPIEMVGYGIPLIILTLSCSFKTENVKGAKTPEIIGSSHVIPRYYFGEEDCLNQGADVLLAMGSKVIKIWY
ncbi:MAG: hypothetical protein KAH99_00910, partial [Verrucomicrobia bacterium]|nr:hypothetical protein [Verrucomicrobiota bacterium]